MKAYTGPRTITATFHAEETRQKGRIDDAGNWVEDGETYVSRRAHWAGQIDGRSYQGTDGWTEAEAIAAAGKVAARMDINDSWYPRCKAVAANYRYSDADRFGTDSTDFFVGQKVVGYGHGGARVGLVEKVGKKNVGVIYVVASSGALWRKSMAFEKVVILEPDLRGSKRSERAADQRDQDAPAVRSTEPRTAAEILGTESPMAAEARNIQYAISVAEADADRLEAGGGPRQLREAAINREHVRLWKIRLDELGQGPTVTGTWWLDDGSGDALPDEDEAEGVVDEHGFETWAPVSTDSAPAEPELHHCSRHRAELGMSCEAAGHATFEPMPTGAVVEAAVVAGAEIELDPPPADFVCLDGHKSECSGPVQYRMALSASGRSFPRCDGHWKLRLAEQERIDETYPDSPIAPDWFDPADAGERWNEDE